MTHDPESCRVLRHTVTERRGVPGLPLRWCDTCGLLTDPAPREAGERHAASPGPLPRSSVSQVAAKVA